MKRKHLIKGLLLTLGFLCTMGLGMANAETTITHYPDSNVEYTLNKGFSTESGFTAGTITISDGETTITMLDRNLGATKAGIGCSETDTGACGYHFQWGNNYGFASNFRVNRNVFPNRETFTRNQKVDTSSYGPSEYSGNIFRNIQDSPYDWSNPKNDNLRGGTGDTEDNSFPVTNATERQGPCPDGFHVPSVGEWRKVLNMLDNDFSRFHGGEGTLMIPFAGYRSNDTYFLYLGSEASLRLSSPSSSYARYLSLKMNQSPSISNRGRVYGFSVRCFYDSYEAYTQSSSLLVNFWDEDGVIQFWSGDIVGDPVCSGEVLSGEVVSGDLLTCVNGLTKQYYTLSGWRDVEADALWTLDTPVVTGLNLQAVWTPDTDANDNGVADEEESFIITREDGDGNFVWSGEFAYGTTPVFGGTQPEKTGYMFSGRYDSESDVWYDIDTITTTGLSFRAVWNKYYIIYFDEDGGSEIQDQYVIENNTGIRPNNPEKFKYIFNGRYDNPEFKGELFDFENILITGNITLYAKRERNEMTTVLISGPDFNSALKGLAGTDTWPDSLNNNIKYFERTGTIPEGVKTGLISTTNSDLPVYARFDDTNGIIYYYTQADKIYAPESMRYMFNGLTVLKNLDLSEWDTSKTTSMRTLFQHCYELESVDMSGWNTSNVTDMSFMFNRCNSLKELDLKNFDTSKVTEMRAMFSECNTLEELDLSSFDTSKVTTMRSMFMGVNSDMNLKSLNISSFNTKNVTDMRAMFQKCSSLTGLDLRNFDTSNVKDMAYMFTSCRSLEHLDVSSFDTSNVTTMTVMFGECPNLVELDVGNFDTTNVTDMSYMFYGLKKLQSLDVSNFHTTNVTNMFGMFAVCSELTELDLSKWDTNKVKNISNMFYGSVNLETVYASENFNTSNVTADESIFLGNKFLVGGNGTVYDKERLNKEYAKIDILGQTGYFTDPNKITVNFMSDDALYTGVTVIRSGKVGRPIKNPTKSGLVFSNWYEDSGFNKVFDFSEGITKYTELYAKFVEQEQKPIYGGGGGGGSSAIKKDICPNGDYSNSYYDGKCGKNTKDSSAMPQNDEKEVQDSSAEPQNDKSGHNSANEVVFDTLRFNPHYSDEMNRAYQFAYHYGITTKSNIKDAAVNQQLTRIAMAKMLSQYAINVLGIQPDKTKNNQFADVSDELNTQYDNGVTLAYQLGIMGINMPSNKFRPYGYVTRAEFATALSRLLYQISDGEYEKTNKYYVNHMNKLLQEKIITVTDPNMKELRGYVMLMLMRSAK